MFLRPFWSVFRQMLELRNFWQFWNTILFFDALVQLSPLHVGEQVLPSLDLPCLSVGEPKTTIFNAIVIL